MKNIHDQWYEVNSSTNLNNLVIDMWSDLNNHILPHFAKLTSKEAVMIAIEEKRKKNS